MEILMTNSGVNMSQGECSISDETQKPSPSPSDVVSFQNDKLSIPDSCVINGDFDWLNHHHSEQ